MLTGSKLAGSQLLTSKPQSKTSLEALAGRLPTRNLLVLLGFNYFATTVEAAWADVVTQMRLTRGGLNRRWRIGQRRMGVMHAALGRRFFVLLNSHDTSPKF
jgi:hypothetical protein